MTTLQLKTSNPQIERLDALTNWLLLGIIVIPFLISGRALIQLAADNHISIPILYPLLVDGGLLIFKSLALRESLRGKRDSFAWAMAIALTIISVLLNILHVPDHLPNVWLARFMAALPPLVLLAAFIAVSRRIEENGRFAHAISTYESIQTTIVQKQKELDAFIAQGKQTVDTFKANQEKERQQLTTQLEQLRQQIQTLTEQKHTLQTAVAATSNRDELTAVTKKHNPAPVTNDKNDKEVLPIMTPQDDKPLSPRQQQVAALQQQGFDKEAIAKKLDVSPRTIYRDIQALSKMTADAPPLQHTQTEATA